MSTSDKDSGVWMVVANGARARIFSVARSSRTIREIEDLVHPETRLPDRLIHEDAPGRVFDRAGQGRHAVDVERSIKPHEKLQFARELATRLDGARIGSEYEQLVVAASPEFLGMLRSSLSDATRARVVASIDKDLTSLAPPEIAAHLPHPLPRDPQRHD